MQNVSPLINPRSGIVQLLLQTMRLLNFQDGDFQKSRHFYKINEDNYLSDQFLIMFNTLIACSF